MEPEKALYFRDQFRRARDIAFRDAEAFHEILYTVERLGYFRAGKALDLGKYKSYIEEVAELSPLCKEVPSRRRTWHVPFSKLYDLVRVARNDALHQGAFARTLTEHATQLSIVLEDALADAATNISDLMVRDPVCALPWQPISFIRQQMLANSFTYLPVLCETGEGPRWKVVSDFDVAQYLRVPNDTDGSQRKERLAVILEAAVDQKMLEPKDATPCIADVTVDEAVRLFPDNGRPLLVLDPEDPRRLLGIVTAFDLL